MEELVWKTHGMLGDIASVNQGMLGYSVNKVRHRIISGDVYKILHIAHNT